jgi:hypothetical protein
MWTANEEKSYTFVSPNLNLNTSSSSTLSSEFDGLTQAIDNNYSIYLNVTAYSGNLGSNSYQRVIVYANGSNRVDVSRTIANGSGTWNFTSSYPPDSVVVYTYTYGGKKSSGRLRAEIKIRNYQ